MPTKQEMTGTCPYCGQEVMVEAYTEEQANIEAAKLCTCDNVIKRRTKLEQLIDDQCGEGCRYYGVFTPLDKKTVDFIKNAAFCILDEDAEACSIKTGDTAVTIKTTNNGVKVTRKEAKTTQWEI